MFFFVIDRTQLDHRNQRDRSKRKEWIEARILQKEEYIIKIDCCRLRRGKQSKI